MGGVSDAGVGGVDEVRSEAAEEMGGRLEEEWLREWSGLEGRLSVRMLSVWVGGAS